MKRPRTYKFSELWEDHQAERATMEMRTDRPHRRRRGRPPGRTFRLKCEAKLRAIARACSKLPLEEVAAKYGVPIDILQEWWNAR